MLLELAIGDAYGAGFEYANDLPQHLVETLENGPYGRDYLVALDKQLPSLNQ